MYIFFKAIGDFLLSTWLWNIFFDWVHVFLNFFVMFFLCRFIMKEKMIRSLVVSLLAQLFAFLVFTGVVAGLIMYVFDLDYEPGGFADGAPIHVMHANLFLAGIYAFLQSGFFLYFRPLSDMRAAGYFMLAMISNGLTALASYPLIRMLMWYSL